MNDRQLSRTAPCHKVRPPPVLAQHIPQWGPSSREPAFERSYRVAAWGLGLLGDLPAGP